MPRSLPRATVFSKGWGGRPAVALGLFYAFYFGHLGVVLPFLPPWLRALGLGPLEVGLVISLHPLGKLTAPWTWGLLADVTGRRRAILAGSSLAAGAALAALAGQSAFPVVLLLVAVYAFCQAPLLPLAETSALEAAVSRRLDYGRVRLWGSLAFIVTAGGLVPVLASSSSARGLAAAGALLLLCGVAGAGLPFRRDPEDGEAQPEHASPEPARAGRAALLLGVCALMQASHGPYYAFYSIRLEDLGYGAAWIGGLWALGVLCEVALLGFSDALVARTGTVGLLRLSLLVAAVRWWGIAGAESLAALMALQALHAFTYAAFHVAALREAYRLFGPRRRVTGQALYSGVSFGLGITLGTLGAGLAASWLDLSGAFRLAALLPLAALLLSGRLVASPAAAPRDPAGPAPG